MGVREGTAASGLEARHDRQENDGASDARFQSADLQCATPATLHRVHSEGEASIGHGAAAGVPVIFSLGAGGKPADIAQDLAPAGDEPIVSSGVDKFMGTDLEKILKEKGIATVIVVGTAAHGAVVYTASGAAMRGMKVIIPVDGVSAETPYVEQYVTWHLANVPVISPAMTLTTIDNVKF